MAAPQRAADLLYDSEAALRLVDAEVARLREEAGHERPSAAAARPPAAHGEGPLPTPGALASASSELRALLQVLRHSRGALEQATVGRLETTQSKLREVTTAAESAVSDILDGLDRAQALVNDLDEADGETDRGRALRARLRDELYVAATHLQFQDIAAQQLNHVTRMLADLEQRLADIACVIDPAGPAFRRTVSVGAPDERTFDPNARHAGAVERQAVADAVFGQAQGPR